MENQRKNSKKDYKINEIYEIKRITEHLSELSKLQTNLIMQLKKNVDKAKFSA